MARKKKLALRVSTLLNLTWKFHERMEKFKCFVFFLSPALKLKKKKKSFHHLIFFHQWHILISSPWIPNSKHSLLCAWDFPLSALEIWWWSQNTKKRRQRKKPEKTKLFIAIHSFTNSQIYCSWQKKKINCSVLLFIYLLID